MNNHLYFTLLLLALLLPASAYSNVDAKDTYDFYVDGIYYDIIGNEATVTCKHLSVNKNGIFSIRSDYRGNVVIPSTVTHNGTTYPVTSVGFSAFYQCYSLTSVTIPNSVTSIESEAFRGCSSLTCVNIPNSVISIGHDAFYGTSWFDHQPDGLVYAGLVAYKYKGIMSEGTSVTIREGTLGIADGAFSGCRDLTSVTIPNSVTSIGSSMFDNCSSLTSVTIPNSVTSIGSRAFFGCSGLTSVSIGNAVTSIGNYAFDSCSGLSSVSIPNSVTYIGDCAFYDCSALTSVNLPNSIVNIGKSAFCECPNISEVMLLNPIPPLCTNMTTFDNNVFNDAKLYVPKESVDLYNAADKWGQFDHIIGVNTSK